MLELPCVTLACIDCVHHELAIAAIEQSLVHCRFGRVLFFTDRDLHLDEFEVLRIPALRTPHEQTRFALTELSGHVTTSHVLFIGWDAFVVNPAAWDVSFLGHDFVAPPYAPEPPLVPRAEAGILLVSHRLLTHPGHAAVAAARTMTAGLRRTLQTVAESAAGFSSAPQQVAERFAFGADYPRGQPFAFEGLQNMWMFFQPQDLHAFLAMATADILASQALQALGVNLRALNRTDEAASIFRAMLRAHPEHEGATTALEAMQAPAALSSLAASRKVVGRNDACPCGSRKKYKQCHGRIGTSAAPGTPLAAADSLVSNGSPGIGSPAEADMAVLLYRARAAFDANDADAAAVRYRQALALRPDDPVALEYLGVIATRAGRLEEAEDLLAQALRLRPAAPEFHNNFGLLHQVRGEFGPAASAYRKALAIDPGYAPASNNLGLALQETGAIGEAIDCFRAAIARQPDFAEAHWNISLALLLSGEFAEGFAEQEWRLQVAQNRDWWARRPQLPQWRGEALAGKRVLILAEQGMGDIIMFVRYAGMLAQRGATVLVEAPGDLFELLQHAPGIAGLVPLDGPYPPCDFQVPVMSLPLAFGTLQETIPARTPYLSADSDPARQARWRSLLGARVKPRVGLAWAGNPSYARDRFRSMPLSAMEPLLSIGNIEWISMQKGAGATEMARLPVELRPRDMGKDSRNFADLAALISQLDLVVTVDTSVVHLAGGLGRPTLLLLDAAHDWRWLRQGAESAWYPTVRLIRQPAPGDWHSVIATAAAELRRRFG